MTALPAITANIAQLPEDARGYVVLEVMAEADIRPLTFPGNIEVHWLVNATADPSGRPLLDRIEQLPWLSGQPAVWAACEFHSMRAMRKYLTHERQVAKPIFIYPVTGKWAAPKISTRLRNEMTPRLNSLRLCGRFRVTISD